MHLQFTIINFLLQITSLENKIDDKIKEIELQSYYTNDMKLKIRFSKIIFAQLELGVGLMYWGNDKI